MLNFGGVYVWNVLSKIWGEDGSNVTLDIFQTGGENPDLSI